MTKSVLIFIVSTIIGAAIGFAYNKASGPVLGGYSTAITANIASTSLQSVGPQSVMTIAATSTCSGRILTTSAKPVNLTFRDTDNPSGMYGVLQPASTTVFYDAVQYGCGKIKAYGFDASTTVNYTGLR